MQRIDKKKIVFIDLTHELLLKDLKFADLVDDETRTSLKPFIGKSDFQQSFIQTKRKKKKNFCERPNLNFRPALPE